MQASRLLNSRGHHSVASSVKTIASARTTSVSTWGETLRVSEKLALAYFAYAAVACFMFPLSARERSAVVGLNLVTGLALVWLGRAGNPERSKFLSTVRDWFPAVLILLAYREAGLFFRSDPAHRLDYLFVRWDTVALKNPVVLGALSAFSPWLQQFLEFSYFLCYPIVPLGAASLILAQRSGALGEERTDRVINRFWTTVLLALFSCYVLFPFFPSTPPRSLFHDLPGPAVHPLFRKVNLWILGRYGNYSNVFPSGHVAGVTATALAVRASLPRLGWVFLIAAASIAAATVYGRYHYSVDALAGALAGAAAFLVCARIHPRR